MSKIKGYLPVFASELYEIDKPDGWDDMTLKEKKDLFIDKAESDASLCHQCSGPIEMDGEINLVEYEKERFWDESDFFEEEE